MIRSLLKWPGGKSRVMPELLPHLPKAGCLVEPFVGGASVFLNTDYRRYILADINPDLILSWLLTLPARSLRPAIPKRNTYRTAAFSTVLKACLMWPARLCFFTSTATATTAWCVTTRAAVITCRLVSIKARLTSRRRRSGSLLRRPTTQKLFFCAARFKTPSK